jgi:hypothetical protein
MEQSARNQLERDQVQRALEKSSGSYRQTSNNQPYSQVWKSLGDSSPGLYCVDLAEAYVMQGNVSSRIYTRRKGMIRNGPTNVRTRNLWKERQNEERMPVLILVPGSHEPLTSRKQVMLGAVLIKNYSSFEKYVKMVPRGFS